MNTKCLSSSLLRIYDRWGGLLFESPEINAGWDGTFKGELLANGVYTFTFEYKLLDSDFSEVKNGTVQLVR
jgi:gliding motility-associated-like protein